MSTGNNMTISARIGNSSSNELLLKFLFFIIWPFGAFVWSVFEANKKSSYLIFFLFGILFCWNMAPRETARYDDFLGMVKIFEHSHYNSEEIGNQVEKYITFDRDAPKELYNNILVWFTKSISNNYHLYFAFASIVYLIFMLGSLKMITDDPKFKICFFSLIILMLFVIPRDLITVQNPRYTTGLWFNIFCTLKYYSAGKVKNRRLYPLLILFSPFFHSGMWLYVGLFWGLSLLSKLNFSMRGALVLFYISIPFSYLSYEILANYSIDLLPIPDTFKTTFRSYTSEATFNKYNTAGTGFTWLQNIFDFIKITFYACIPYFLYKYRNTIKTVHTKHFLTYLFLLGAIVNFIQSVPVLGLRYTYFFQILALYAWYKVVYPRNDKFLLVGLAGWTFYIVNRYFYKGAVSVCVPPDTWFLPAPFMIFQNL